jgi:hypothetical protein
MEAKKPKSEGLAVDSNLMQALAARTLELHPPEKAFDFYGPALGTVKYVATGRIVDTASNANTEASDPEATDRTSDDSKAETASSGRRKRDLQGLTGRDYRGKALAARPADWHK